MLNKQQQEVVEMINGPIMVLSVAGSGKTTTVIQRMANLISKGVNPSNILGLTFSTKAARELQERVSNIIGKQGFWITTKTFHGFGFQRLREDGAAIGINQNFTLQTSDYQRTGIVNEVLKDLGLDSVYNRKTDGNDIRKLIDQCKINVINAGNFLQSGFPVSPYDRKSFSRIYIKYQEKLKNKNQLDFGDLILHTIRLLENKEIREKYQERYKYIFVDEYQDTNKGQYKIMQMLSEKHKNICVVGDLDQRIYGFQGANPDAADQFMTDFPEYKIMKMEQNYRSTPNILNAANELISNNTARIPTKMWTETESSNLVHLMEHQTDEDEAKTIVDDILKKMEEDPNLKYKDFAILYRLNRLSSKFEAVLNNKKIPFVMGKKENHFYNQDEVTDILSYLRLLNNPDDREAAIHNLFLKRGVGKDTIAKLSECSETHKISFMQAIRENVAKNPKYLCKNIGGQLKALADYLVGVDYLIEFNKTHLLDDVINEIVGYSSYVQDILRTGSTVDNDRYQNILEVQKEILLYVDKQKSLGETYTIKKFLDEVDSMMFEDDEEEKNGIILSTIHGAKGREFQYVYIIGFDDKVIPFVATHYDDNSLEEERRLAYVAITRAKHQVTISHCEKTYNVFNKRYEPVLPSRFLDEIPNKYLKIV